MSIKVNYGTVTEALKDFNEKGYTVDLNLDKNCLAIKNENGTHDDFIITEVYRYEGVSNPEDEATVYAIESSKGVKGVFVTGYSYEHSACEQEILDKLHY